MTLLKEKGQEVHGIRHVDGGIAVHVEQHQVSPLIQPGAIAELRYAGAAQENPQIANGIRDIQGTVLVDVPGALPPR